VTPTFKGETQFLAWGDGPSGPWIKLLLPDSDDLLPFRGMTAAKKGMAGQRLACVLVEIDDDETPKTNDAVKGGDLARLAGVLCASEAFRAWFWSGRAWMQAGSVARIVGSTFDEDETAEAVRAVCGVISRAQLDHDPEAAQRFHELIRRPYNEHVTRKQP
jgi:hypothetical protein